MMTVNLMVTFDHLTRAETFSSCGNDVMQVPLLCGLPENRNLCTLYSLTKDIM